MTRGHIAENEAGSDTSEPAAAGEVRRPHHRSSELRYSSCNEDLDTELVGLEIGPGDHVLAVAGGGGRAIGLLLADPARVVAVDSNPAQCHLLELKKAAFLTLGHGELLTFLGLDGEGAERLAMWPRVEAQLPPRPREFWRERGGLVEKGVLFAGSYEQQVRRSAKYLRLLFGKELGALFACSDLGEQRRVWSRLQSRWIWRFGLRVASNPYWYRYIFRRYGWLRDAPAGGLLSRVAIDRFDRFIARHLARDSHVLQLRFYGDYLPGAALPNYLRPEHFTEIRARLCRLEVAATSLFDLLEDPSRESFDKFSLSNVPTYLRPEEFARLWRALARAGRPGARVVYRQVLFDRGLPPGLSGVVRRQPAVEKLMGDIDKSVVYEVLAFEVTGDGRQRPSGTPCAREGLRS